MIYGQPIRTVPPVAQVVSVLEAKEHLNITESASDALIARFTRAATAKVEQYTGLGLLTQTWSQTFSAFADVMQLKRRPLLAVGSPAVAATVAYLDSTATLQTLAGSTYRVTGIGADKAFGAIRLGFGQTWPTIYDDAEAVTVTYTVGYGSTGESVPDTIRQAIMSIVGDWYAWRENMAEGSVNELPFGVTDLLYDFRPLSVA